MQIAAKLPDSLEQQVIQYKVHLSYALWLLYKIERMTITKAVELVQ